MVRHLAAKVINECRGQVDGLDQRTAARAARGVRLRGGVDDDQRDLRGLLVEQVLLTHPVIAEIVAMIRGEHDHGGFQQVAFLQKFHQNAHLVVDLGDQAHIGRDHLLPGVVARHVAGVAHVHIGAEHWMRVLPLALGTDHRQHV